MGELERLKREAQETAEGRGHTMGKWLEQANYAGVYSTANAVCRRCGAGAFVDINPPANGIDIAGRAVALTCPAEES